MVKKEGQQREGKEVERKKGWERKGEIEGKLREQ